MIARDTPLRSLGDVRSAFGRAYLLLDERPGGFLATDAAGLTVEVTGRPAAVELSVDVGPSYLFVASELAAAAAAFPASEVLERNERVRILRRLSYGQLDVPGLLAATADLGRAAAKLRRAPGAWGRDGSHAPRRPTRARFASL